MRRVITTVSSGISLLSLLLGCADDPQGPGKRDQVVWKCSIDSGSEVDYSTTLGCTGDFDALASEPLDASIPGATSVKTVIDIGFDGTLYFQNSIKFTIHHAFASALLSGDGKPLVTTNTGEFNEYYIPDRRFVLGAITYYAGKGVWTYEIAPYDNASADMIAMAYTMIADSCFFGDSLYFHPTSVTVDKEAKKLPDSILIITTDELFAGMEYQPLNYGTSYGRLVFMTAASLDTGYVGFRDIVVLDLVPNDISVTSGIITEAFQTPLAHINVLSRNRGTPNMGLKGAYSNAQLRSLENKWVKYEVKSHEWSVTEVTLEEADAWWEDHKPATIGIAKMNLDVKDLRDDKEILDLENLSLADAIDSAIPAFGGKASHFGAFPHMDSNLVPHPKGFAVPVFYYWQFMEQNGFNAQMTELLADAEFKGDPSIRSEKLEKLRKAIEKAPVDSTFTATLMNKLNTEYPGITMRFRSSTNAEDLDGFTGAGLYTSKSGDPGDVDDILDAIREVWSSVWYFRAFEERSYRNIDHMSVGMALLVHNSFPDEEATGVAISNNPFDSSGLEPAFYINVQYGDASVVLPDANITTDELIYYYDMPGQPIEYLGHSNQIPEGTNVLTATQVYKLGLALKEINRFFQPAYGTVQGKWWAMDTEFKFDQPLGDPDGEPVLSMKQARPYPWGKE